MRVGLYHGYELTGSGSNEYTRYLSRALADAGHEVHVLCRESRPEAIEHASRAVAWDADGNPSELFSREREWSCTLHLLPHASVRPVYLTDKQRAGSVKAFGALTPAELREYHDLNVAVVRAVLARHPVEVLHANHLIYQPTVAAETDTPFVVFPHGSSIEYVLRSDDRLRDLAAEALRRAAGLISGSEEVLERILRLYPEDAAELRARSEIVGVGVDTSLFRPVERAERRASVRRIRGDPPGKRPEQRTELCTRLDAGDRAALTDYGAAYDHGRPDADLETRLDGLPWESGRFLLFVGALTAGKGLQSVIAALPALLRRHPSAHLLVVGSGAYREVLEGLVHAIDTGNEGLFLYLRDRGFDLDRSELTGSWADVRSFPARPGLGDHVHFVGRLDHTLLRHLFPCVDLAVFPSVVPEAYPLVLMESLSNGVLPVVSDFSGFADGLATLLPLLGAELVDAMRLPVKPSGRVEAIAERLAGLLDRHDLPRWSPRLRALAVEHFDWSVRARQMAEAYSRLVTRSRNAWTLRR